MTKTIKMKLTNFILLAFTTLIISCGGPNYADDPLMQEAFAIHQEASKVEKEILPKMEDLIQIKTSMNVAGKALTETEISQIAKIEQIEKSMKYWKENIPDVPGFKHEHHAHEGPCNHGPKLELLPEDWVIVQKEFKDSILVIKERIETVLQSSP